MFGRGLAVLLVALVLPGAAAADDWWPHPADASWVYQWSDTVYAQVPTTEKVTVKDQKGKAFTLAWTTEGQDNPDGAIVGSGTAAFSDSPLGLVNTDWSSTPPPPTFPVLCARAAGCANSLSDTLYDVIWGSRNPLFAEPLLQGAQWSSAGGAAGDVTSTSTYQGMELVKVPAFPDGVSAAKVRSEITQAGALGDPYGSGTRTVWWVNGVGPVKVEFDHSGGGSAPVTTSVLQSTNQTPKPAPADANFFPNTKGMTLRFRWTNSKYLRKPSVQEFTVTESVNGSARFDVKSLSGPIKVAGSYAFSTRLDGVTNIWGNTAAATAAKFPPLGPASAPAGQRRHFFTPFDLLIFGFNPVITAFPSVGESWQSQSPSRDFSIFGVTGTAQIVGSQQVVVPAGRFQALVVRAVLRQPGFRFGSGTRTAYFAAGKGLVKLVFAHSDGSVSTVLRLK